MSGTNLLKAEPTSHCGKTNVWLTPRLLLNSLGPFDLDPCGCLGWDTAAKHFYEKDDGLHQDWEGLAWVNPPYGNDVHHWVTRWAKHGNGFLLLAARTETQWFRDAAFASDLICFPRKRIKFHPSDGSKRGSPAFPSVLFAAGAVASSRVMRINGLYWMPIQSASEIKKGDGDELPRRGLAVSDCSDRRGRASETEPT